MEEDKRIICSFPKSYLWANGKQINIFYVNDCDEYKEYKNIISKYLNETLNIDLYFPIVDEEKESHVRIGFEKGKGNFSEVGKASLNKKGITTNIDPDKLQDLSPEDVNKTIIHMVDHILGNRFEDNCCKLENFKDCTKDWNICYEYPNTDALYCTSDLL